MPKKSIYNRKELYTGFKTSFFNAFDLASQVSLVGTVAMQVESTGAEEAYSWLGGLPVVREFLDERQASQLVAYDFTIKNKEWESTLEVKRTELDDDKYGLIRLRIGTMAEAAARHPDDLLVSLLLAGFDHNCYDGQYFFDTDHPVGEGQAATSVSNKGAVAISEANLQAAITLMMKRTDNKGRSLNVCPTHLVVGPEKQWLAKEIVGREYTMDANAKPNLLKGILTVIVTPLITGNHWFLLDCSKQIKPLVYQVHTPVEFSSLEGDSDTGFMRNAYYYGTYARYNVGYGLWQLAYGSTG